MQAFMADMPKHWLEERKNSEASQRDEMWNGVLHMPPMPMNSHQDFQGALHAYLRYRWALPQRHKALPEVNLAPPDEQDWRDNYRVPDILLLTRDRFSIDRGSHFAGAPLVVVEIHSPGDESYEKLPFYAALGTPEVWIIDRDTKAVEIRQLGPDRQYTLLQPDPDGWLRSPATGVEFRRSNPGKVTLRVRGDDATAEEIPDA